MKTNIKNLNAIGAAHIVLPLLIIVGAGITGTYVAVHSVSHADSRMVRIYPNELENIKERTADFSPGYIVSDGTHNGKADTAFMLRPLSHTQIKDKSKVKIARFLRQHRGEKAKFCVTAKVSDPNLAPKLEVASANLVTGKSIDFSIALHKKYSTKCKNFKISNTKYAYRNEGALLIGMYFRNKSKSFDNVEAAHIKIDDIKIQLR